MDTIYIVGTSGFAREVNDVVVACGMRAVFVAASLQERDGFSGSEEVILESELSAHAPCKMAIGIGDNAVRRMVAAKLAPHGEFVTLIHPSASFGAGQREVIEACQGVIVCAGARFMNSISVGNFSVVSLNATIGHDSVIAPFCLIAPGANLSGHVHLKEGVWIGTGAAVNQGTAANPLTIGANTMIGSGSVVLSDCLADSTYVGNPARKLERP